MKIWHLFDLASLLDKQEVQEICGHTGLRARKWSGLICKRRQDIRHYRTNIHSFDWKSAVEHDGGV